MRRKFAARGGCTLPLAAACVLGIAAPAGVRAFTGQTNAPGSASCIGDDGSPVDWFAAFKFPHGTDYAYADSNSPSLRRSAKTLDDGAVAVTLNSLYEASTKDSLWAMFNDEPTNHGAEGDSFAHQKGVVFSGAAGGFWLVHSVPKFPAVFGSAYSYPVKQSEYGQSFLCMSLSAAGIESAAKTLLTSRPYVYDKNVPASLAATFPFFEKMASNPTASHAAKVLGHSTVTPATAALTTAGGASFTAFEKSGKWGQDLYEDLVAGALGSSLLAETWMRPAMQSYCTPAQAYSVMNVKTLSMAGATWDEGQDHSKWAVSTSGAKPTVCIGGVNRMLSQRKRGGGTVCFEQAALWKSLMAAILTHDECPGAST